MNSVLFVCLGNICRSPAAQGVFAALAEKFDLTCEIDSAGTADWHSGDPPYGPMITHAAARGVDLSRLRARQFQVADFALFDLIIAMDRQNLADIQALRPRGNLTPTRLFLGYGENAPAPDLPDPYYTRDFDAALDLIEQASNDLLAHWQT